MAGWWWVTQKIANGICNKIKHNELLLIWMSRRLMTAKVPNRAAVHGTKLAVTKTIDIRTIQSHYLPHTDRVKRRKRSIKGRRKIHRYTQSSKSKNKRIKKNLTMSVAVGIGLPTGMWPVAVGGEGGGRRAKEDRRNHEEDGDRGVHRKS
ncbi:unnamed protein product [Dovyalis caffra]|uniref:Uncharacterized protein n=1 Tax=Dovyalis caffra TaxID=77055 RepID=A0AAV1SC03_9ROSI|nr:unnamed protein product [Dovyalis caffra]